MTITKRGTKGSALTYNEMDENIRDLYEDTTINRVFTNASGSGSDVQHLTYAAPSNSALNDHDDPGFITINYNTRLKMAAVDEDDESFCCVNMLDMQNHNIIGVNHLKFSDPGPGEGLQWSNIKIQESPDDLITNTAGNLQVVYKQADNSYARRFTVKDTGVDVVGTIENEHFTIPNSAGTSGQVLKWPSSGTVLEWASGGSSYRKGEVIEYLTGLGDGRTIDAEADGSGNSRDVTMDTADQTQYGQSVYSHSNSGYQTVSGTEFDYYPPAGTKTVEITYEIYVGGIYSLGHSNNPNYDDALLHFKPKVDGTYLTDRPLNYFGAHGFKEGLFTTTIVLSVDGTGNTAAGNINTWTSAKTIKLDVAEYTNTGAFRLHLVNLMDGGGNGNHHKTGNVMPTVRIVATA